MKFNKNLEIILFLIKKTKKINLQNSQKWTNLFFFVKYQKKIEILENLIQKGIDINLENKIGWNSFMLAALQNTNIKILQILLKNSKKEKNFENEKKKKNFKNESDNFFIKKAFFLSQKNDNKKIPIFLLRNIKEIFICEKSRFTFIHFYYLFFEEEYDCKKNLFEDLKGNDVKCVFGWSGDFYREWKKRERNVQYMRIFYN